MEKRKILLIVLLISILPLISANGLRIDPESINVTKLNNQEKNISFTVFNEEPFSFYNMSSENNLLSFGEFTLGSGQNKTVNALINTNSNFEGVTRIKGTYFSNVGQQNITENLTVNDNGISLCNLDLIAGDKIIWNNDLFSEIKLKNVDSGDYFATIPGKQNHEQHFTSPIEIRYLIYRAGVPFGDICTINIESTNDYSHKLAYDGILTLNLTIDYGQTNMTYSFLSDSYSLSINEEKEDIFSIKNTGSTIAKDIIISGNWTRFSTGGADYKEIISLDVPPGESKNIAYKISPQVSTTNQTNKHHNITIEIKGNFETLRKTLDIFVQYYDLDSIFQGTSVDKETMRQFIKLYCEQDPDACPKIIVNASSLGRNITLVTTEDAWIESQEANSRFQEQMLSSVSTITERQDNLETKFDSKITTNDEEKVKLDDINDSVSIMTYVVWALISLIVLSILGYMVYYISQRSLVPIKLSKYFGRGERW